MTPVDALRHCRRCDVGWYGGTRCWVCGGFGWDGRIGWFPSLAESPEYREGAA